MASKYFWKTKRNTRLVYFLCSLVILRIFVFFPSKLLQPSTLIYFSSSQLSNDQYKTLIHRFKGNEQNLDSWSQNRVLSLEKNKFHSQLECSVPEESYKDYKYTVCHCYDCCVHNGDVYVFDGSSQEHSNVTVQVFGSKRSIGVLHYPPNDIESNEHQLIHEFDNSPWVNDPVHYTTMFYEHILSLWFWNADVWNTWRKERFVSKDSFHWMLQYNLNKREHLVDTWYALTHPKNEVPIRLYRNANKINREKKMCYRHLLIGNHHVAQGIWENTTKGERLIGQNTKPNFKIEPNASRLLNDYVDFYLLKSGLINIYPQPRKAVYISRQDSSRRRILNRQELLEVVQEEGFEVEEVFLAEMSIDEANEKLRSASLVFGPHGAGFANTIIMGKGTVIMELHPFGYQKWVYAHMARAMGQFYHYW